VIELTGDLDQVKRHYETFPKGHVEARLIIKLIERVDNLETAGTSLLDAICGTGLGSIDGAEKMRTESLEAWSKLVKGD